MRVFEAPSERAASMNSFSRSESDLAADDARHVGPLGERDHEDHDRQARLR